MSPGGDTGHVRQVRLRQPLRHRLPSHPDEPSHRRLRQVHRPQETGNPAPRVFKCWLRNELVKTVERD